MAIALQLPASPTSPSPPRARLVTAKAITSTVRAGLMMKLGKRVTKKNVELTAFGTAAAAEAGASLHRSPSHLR